VVNDNPNGAGMNPDVTLEQELNGLRRQYEHLRDQRVRAETQVADLSGRLDALKAQALEEYGTSDPKELQRLLQDKRQENERIVAEYREHIQTVQSDLAQVENRTDGDG